MFDILAVLACFYFAYSNVKMLMELPLAQWGAVQYVMALLTVALVVVGGLKGWQAYKKDKQKKAAEAAEAAQMKKYSPGYNAWEDEEDAGFGEDEEEERKDGETKG